MIGADDDAVAVSVVRRGEAIQIGVPLDVLEARYAGVLQPVVDVLVPGLPVRLERPQPQHNLVRHLELPLRWHVQELRTLVSKGR